MSRKAWYLVGVLVAAGLLTVAIPKIQRKLHRRDSIKTYRGAIISFAVPPDVTPLTANLPKVDGKYLFEGDLLLTEADLGKLLEERKTKASTDVLTGFIQKVPQEQQKEQKAMFQVLRDPSLWVQLKVERAFNSTLPNIYPVTMRTLSYGIYRADFSDAEYQRISNAMLEASGDWVAACLECGISFTHRTASDADTQPGAATFIIRKSDGDQFLAYSFFPGTQGGDKILKVYPDFFDTRWNQAGILRHELGHVLGYVHEFNEEENTGTTCVWDGRSWNRITDYDSKSVMHFCAGDHNQDTTLKLTALDIQGHRLVYGSH